MQANDLTAIGRLEAYLNILRRLRYDGVVNAAAPLLAAQAGRAVSVIIEDLETIGFTGSITTKYDTETLIEKIETVLGWDNKSDAVLVGVGKLGCALMAHEDYRCDNLNIIAAFDSDPHKIGHHTMGLGILPVAKLVSLVERLHIPIGIIAVPPAQAQIIADLLGQAGVSHIINFTEQTIVIPEGVTVKYEERLQTVTAA